MKKKTNQKNISEWLYWLGILILPTILFFILFSRNAPSSLANILSTFKLIHFLIVILIFFFLFQFDHNAIRILTCGLCVALFALPMVANLIKGTSSATIIGGFIPYKDGFHYYNGANMLLAGQRIPAQGLNGAWRPLFPGWLSILLLATNNNLILALQLMILISAFSCYFASETIKLEFGPLPAAVFLGLTYAFIRPLIGNTLTEIASLGFACISLILLFNTVRSRNLFEAVLGGFMLILAISIRAGAFFMLPLIVFWLGWHFRGKKKTSISITIAFAVVLLAFFLIANIIFPRLVTEEGASTFGNFAYMLYGQAVGGAGFLYHFEALGTTDSAIVMQAALERIRAYPLSLFIGFAKSYRDFFSNTMIGIFNLLSGEDEIFRWVFWLMMNVLLIFGLIKSIRKIKQPQNMLLLACFLGLLLSIPFLPPIDGGNRFYAGSIPFLFALMAINLPVLQLIPSKTNHDANKSSIATLSGYLAALLSAALLIGPVLILHFNDGEYPDNKVNCDSDATTIQVQYSKGAYVDILPDENSDCGYSPELCFNAFASNGIDKKTDDFYNVLVDMAHDSTEGIRVWAGIDWSSGQYTFIFLPLEIVDNTMPDQQIFSCGKIIKTQFQTLRAIEEIIQDGLFTES